MMTAKTLRFARAPLRRSWVRALVAALLIGGTDVVLSADPAADPLAGKWSLTYHLTVKPGHETFAVPESPGTTVTRQVYVTHVCQPAFTVNPDGKFAFTADDTGCNRYEHDATSPGGAGTGVGKWQVFLKVSEGQVNANGSVVRLTLDQAFGSGSVTTVSGGMTVKTDATTTRDSDTLAVVVRSPGGVGNYQLPKGPGGYAPFSKWGSQKWELTKTSQEGTTTIYSASRDKQLAGGLLVVETVVVQKDTKVADLTVSLGDDASYPPPGGTGTVRAVVSNKGPSAALAVLKIRVVGGDIYSEGYAESNFNVLKYTGGTTEATMLKTDSFHEYYFTYQFALASGAQKTVEIEAMDTTPAGQTLPYIILFQADVKGDLPDPNEGNNFDQREVTFNPPKKKPPKAISPKTK